jgi:hypothetical protein
MQGKRTLSGLRTELGSLHRHHLLCPIVYDFYRLWGLLLLRNVLYGMSHWYKLHSRNKRKVLGRYGGSL